MHSLRAVFLELWQPFGTNMERHIVLSELKQIGELPPAWVAEFSDLVSLLQPLMSLSLIDLPPAVELLKHALPLRMEYELLDNMLQTMHNSKEPGDYDKVVNAILNEEILSTKDHHENVRRFVLARKDTFPIQNADFDIEV